MKFRGEQTDQTEENQEETIEHELEGNDRELRQLLFLELVRGDRSGSGKRKRGTRAGRWASWTVDKSRRGRRVWKRGLRRY